MKPEPRLTLKHDLEISPQVVVDFCVGGWCHAFFDNKESLVFFLTKLVWETPLPMITQAVLVCIFFHFLMPFKLILFDAFSSRFLFQPSYVQHFSFNVIIIIIIFVTNWNVCSPDFLKRERNSCLTCWKIGEEHCPMWRFGPDPICTCLSDVSSPTPSFDVLFFTTAAISTYVCSTWVCSFFNFYKNIYEVSPFFFGHFFNV